jgi:hypothetical protein
MRMRKPIKPLTLLLDALFFRLPGTMSPLRPWFPYASYGLGSSDRIF